MEYPIQEVARAAGTTSRTLRHYDDVGLVKPSRVGRGGYRYYDDRALVRLQRTLLLRELGLGLDAIAQVLAAQDAQAATSEGAAAAEIGILTAHLELLRRERGRVETQIGAVERTIAALAHTHDEGEDLMSENIFDGFDHTQHRDEVIERWGADAYANSDRWWRGLGERGQAEWKERAHRLGLDWIEAAERGEDPGSPAAQEIARRHVEWLRGIPGTPAHRETHRVSVPGFVRSQPLPAHELGGDLAGYVLGLADMYVADERFAANYGGVEGATFVRDALRLYVERGAAG